MSLLVTSLRTLRLAASSSCASCSTTAFRAYATTSAAAPAAPAATSTPAPAAATPAAASSEVKTWTPYSVRTGLLVKKRGTTTLWDDKGKAMPVTVLQLEDLQVVGHLAPAIHDPKRPPPFSAKPHLHALQLGSTNHPNPKRMKAADIGQFIRVGLPPKRKVKEFRVTEDALLPIGTTLSAGHFVPGQHVDVTGTSVGKGFAGVMKRHGFHGLKATHGVSKTHRSAGSTGQHQDPGRVFPGHKMAGHMGTDTVTIHNLQVVRVDTVLNLIFVKGLVPGNDDSWLTVRDAVRKVKWVGQKNFKAGLQPGEWLKSFGVVTLPFPAGTTDQVWPPVIEMGSVKVETEE